LHPSRQGNEQAVGQQLIPQVTFATDFSPHVQFDKVKVDVPKLSAFFDGKYIDIKKNVRQMIEKTHWEHDFDADTLTYPEERKLFLRMVKILVDNLPFDLEDTIRNNYPAFITYMEEIALLNSNVIIKFAVQYLLFFGSIVSLGTERHRKILNDAKTMKLHGLFGMTEKGHGSNVRGIETTATYDKRTREFVINTPHLKAMKSWIGGSGSAHLGAIFAQLIIDGKNHGVHVFLVPLRDERGNVLPGITFEDCGYKMGLNGVDNMSIGFDHVRIPRENLLNRLSDVTEDGQYINRCGTESKHFASTVGELTGGRACLSAQAITIAKMALTIAIRYAFERKQFGPPGKPEIPIIQYPTHQRRLMPLLARTVAMVPYLSYCKEVYAMKHKDPSSVPLLHSVTSVIKAASSWHLVNVLDICRQCCGAAGYRAANKLSQMLRDNHIWVTFEGDNTVLTQQTAKFLLAIYERGLKSGQFSDLLSYANKRVESLPISVTNPDEKLLNVKFQQNLFQEREFLLLQELATNLQRRKQNGESDWDAFNAELVLAKNLAIAHADRVIHESFAESSQICSFVNTGILTVLVKLNALKQIQEDLGWFTANEVLTPSLARRVEPLINALCKEVCLYSLDIIKAFQIPEKLLPPADLSNYVLPSNTMFYGK
jgi:acyl-CoA oxidase